MTEKRYLVALPIASLDLGGRSLPAERVREWTERVQEEMTRMFGGATVIAAPGSSGVVDDAGARLRLRLLPGRGQGMSGNEDAARDCPEWPRDRNRESAGREGSARKGTLK